MTSRKVNFRKTLTIILSICLLINANKVFAYDQPDDQLETFNRLSFRFNKALDKVIFKPVAIVYNTIVPCPIKKGVSNFFSNLGEVPTIANGLLQGKFHQATSDFSRLVINSTLGIGGIFDVATCVGIPKHVEDLGLTFARWGARRSTYLVLPIFGPSTIRDALALPVSLTYLTVYPYINDIPLRNSLFALNTVNQRASLLDLERIAKIASYDQYAFQRDAYLQHREYLMRGESTEFSRAGVKNIIPLP